ncbi:MAG: endonuclease/exonuclease/phosphatase family protein [Bacteroidota bacterium]|nr:endonuclease/exonuclease/phosphatase family protein [Bacteroidota bacterium]
MTYNLEGMKPGTDPQTRIFNAIQYLKQLNPDVIGLQEINESLNTGGSDNQAKVIADSLSAYFHIPYYTYTGFTHQSWSNTFNEYIGIISRYPVQETGFLDLVKGAFPRKVVWNQITTPLGKINFFNTHLDYLNTAVRIQQVQQIIGYVAQKDTSFPAIASILTGDFNDVPGTSPILLLTNTGTDTSFIDTYHAANPAVQGYTIPANAPSSRIDFIFYKSTGRLSINSSLVVMNEPYGGINYPSDHLGVMTIFKKSITGVDNKGRVEGLKNFELYQNFPNPFNPATVIKFSVPISSRVSLKIFNSTGQEVADVDSKEYAEGAYTATWNAAGFASGVYFYRLQAGNIVVTKKLMLLK